MASEQRNRLVPSVKIAFLYKLTPKGTFLDQFLVPQHDPVKNHICPLVMSPSQGELSTGNRWPCVLIRDHGKELLLDAERTRRA